MVGFFLVCSWAGPGGWTLVFPRFFYRGVFRSFLGHLRTPLPGTVRFLVVIFCRGGGADLPNCPTGLITPHLVYLLRCFLGGGGGGFSGDGSSSKEVPSMIGGGGW